MLEVHGRSWRAVCGEVREEAACRPAVHGAGAGGGGAEAGEQQPGRSGCAWPGCPGSCSPCRTHQRSNRFEQIREEETADPRCWSRQEGALRTELTALQREKRALSRRVPSARPKSAALEGVTV